MKAVHISNKREVASVYVKSVQPLLHIFEKITTAKFSTKMIGKRNEYLVQKFGKKHNEYLELL